MEKWAFSYKIKNTNPLIKIGCLQEKSTGRNESYHSVLKGKGVGEVLKKSNLFISLTTIFNTSVEWNQKHVKVRGDLYSPYLVPNLFTYTPTILNLLSHVLRDKYHQEFKAALEMSLQGNEIKRVKWSNLSPWEHSCHIKEAYGIPCKHIIFIFIPYTSPSPSPSPSLSLFLFLFLH